MRIDFGICLIGALMVLVLPIQWLAAAVIAALVHEGCHLAVMKLLDVKVLGIRIGIGGASIHAAPMEPVEELLCALVGPLGSIGLICLSRFFPRIAVCGLAQGLYNLLPIYPLDGGRILQGCVMVLFPEQAERILAAAEILMMVGLVLGTVVLGWVFQLGVLPIIFFVFVILKAFQRKIPCKEVRIGVQ